MKVKPIPMLLVTDLRVYPTARPEEAREVGVPPQTAKLKAITRAQLEEARKRGRE